MSYKLKRYRDKWERRDRDGESTAKSIFRYYRKKSSVQKEIKLIWRLANEKPNTTAKTLESKSSSALILTHLLGLMESTGLINLMKEKDYDTITIVEISERALLTRRTFYRNFSSKRGVLEVYCEKLCEEYISNFREDALSHIVETFFLFWEVHIGFLKLLLKNGLLFYLVEKFNIFLPQIYQKFKGNWNEYSSEIELEYSLLFSAGGLWNVLSKWAEKEDRPSPKEMEKIILQSISKFNQLPATLNPQML